MKNNHNKLSTDANTMQSMLNNYEEAIWSVDRELKFTFVNSYFIKDFKEAFDIDLKPGMHAFGNVRMEMQNIWKPKYEAALRGGKISFEFEEDELRGKKYFRVNLNPIHKNGIISGVSVISVDITKQKLSELKVQRELERSRQYMDISGVMFVAINKKGNTTLVNKKLCEITGYREEDLIGNNWFKMMVPEHLYKEIIPVSEKLLNGEIEPVEYYENPILKKDGKERLIAWHNTILKDENGEITGHLSSGEDITERRFNENKVKKLLKEKNIILKEVHHRIKNNMTTLISLIALQINTVKGKEAKNALLELENRIRSMMVLYETLYQSTDFQSVSAKLYFSALIDNIIANFPNSKKISAIKNISDFQIDAKTIFNMGIIINELITNTMKYAFNNRPSGEINISADIKNNNLLFIVADNGVGIPKDIDLNKNPGFGMKLIMMLVKQMSGDIQIERGKGTKFIIKIQL